MTRERILEGWLLGWMPNPGLSPDTGGKILASFKIKKSSHTSLQMGWERLNQRRTEVIYFSPLLPYTGHPMSTPVHNLPDSAIWSGMIDYSKLPLEANGHQRGYVYNLRQREIYIHDESRQIRQGMNIRAIARSLQSSAGTSLSSLSFIISSATRTNCSHECRNAP